MQLAELTEVVNSWEKEIDEITKLVEEWQGSTIYIDVNQEDLEKNEKYQLIMKKWNIFKANIEKRLQGLRTKIVKHLHNIYETATKRLEPHKTLVEMLLNISPDLGIIVEALKKIGEFFTQAYEETLATVNAVLSLVTKVIDLTSKLASLSTPNIVLRDNTHVKLPAPTWEPITLGDITGG